VGCRASVVLVAVPAAGLSDAMKQQMLPCRLAREVYWSGKLRNVGFDTLDAMQCTTLEPESKAWRHELLQARGDFAAATALREEIVEQHPGLRWFLSRIEEGAELRLISLAHSHAKKGK